VLTGVGVDVSKYFGVGAGVWNVVPERTRSLKMWLRSSLVATWT